MIPKIGLRIEFLKKWATTFKTQEMTDVSTHTYILYAKKKKTFFLNFLGKKIKFFSCFQHGKNRLKIASFNFLK